jgi:hypothetical protein
MRLERDRVSARADERDDGSLIDGIALRDQQLSELEERDGIAVGGLDRERLTASRDSAGERHGSRGRRVDVGAELAADVDPAMLVAGIRIGPEHEGPEDRPAGRPRPRVRGRHDQKRGHHSRERYSPHVRPPKARLVGRVRR